MLIRTLLMASELAFDTIVLYLLRRGGRELQFADDAKLTLMWL
jgi:hypothetical protein